MDLVSITDLTKQLDVSSRTLRYYEQAGLIQSVRPQFKRHRYYEARTIARLEQILVLRKMEIPIKDIVRIYQSGDMSVVVEVFVDRVRAIDQQVDALSELKRIVNEFLERMIAHGIKKISALPLLYEEMERREARKAATYERLTAASERLAGTPDISIIDLPSMRVLSSRCRESGSSDVEGFWGWLTRRGIQHGLPGQRTMFEYQDDAHQTVIIQRIDDDFHNDSPYVDYELEGGFFAAGGVYVDEDVGAFHQRMMEGFDGNPYYEVDYLHDGRMRHESMVEPVVSPDSMRERVNVLVPVKRRVPDASLYAANEEVDAISAREVEEANPVLWAEDVPLDGLTPILGPHYRINENGEAEYIAYISDRVLSTEVRVRLPFRVDVEFRIDAATARFGYGADEGSIRFYHDDRMFGINMENHADERLSREAIAFTQPIFGDHFSYPGRGRVRHGAYNHLTWIVGAKHFAVIINGEVRYCGTKYPYMAADLQAQEPHPVIVGSNGQGKVFFRSIRVSQLRGAPRIRTRQGALATAVRQSNNAIPGIHQLITSRHGENYWFNGCARYVMECLGEPELDYWLFAGLTGDNLAQVYSYDHFRGDGATDYLLGDGGNTRFIGNAFAACGYESTFVREEALRASPDIYVQALVDSIDKGVPVIRRRQGWGVYVGYEEYGKALLYLTGERREPERLSLDRVLPEPTAGDEAACCGWVFVGEKREQRDLGQIYRDAVVALPKLLTTETDCYCFGPEAFRTWASDIEGGRYDGLLPEQFDPWAMYTVYVCNLATNSGGCQSFLSKAQELNPDFGFLDEVREQYRQTGHLWNNQNGEDLEALGGGFNVTLSALQDGTSRGRIAATIREFAVCMDSVLAVLDTNL
jgi:DNA-binding transcriptional MerR regulator